MNIALILSGGTGTRLGTDIPKQYIKIKNRPILSFVLERLSMHSQIDAVQIVADAKWREQIIQWMEEDWKKKFRGFSDPGENRQSSILHGLEDIRNYADDSDYVMVHDAARPMLSEQMITECLEGVKGHEGLVPVLPMKDTVYQSKDGKTICSLLKRNEIFAGQAPEVFQLAPYYKANKELYPERILEINGSTEPAVMSGMDIIMISGDENNFKITTKADLERFENSADFCNLY